MMRAVNLLAPLLATIMVLAGVVPVSAQDSCLSNRELQAAIANGEIPPVAEVLQQAGIDRSTEVLSVQACGAGGAFSYHVGVLDAYGEASTLVLQASGASQ